MRTSALSACTLLHQGRNAHTACQSCRAGNTATLPRLSASWECSWLPLYLGDATLYLEACPRMSFFLAGALLTLGFNLLHTSSMVLAFSGWAHQRRERWMAVPCAHLLAALLVASHSPRPGSTVGSSGSLATYAQLLKGAASWSKFCPVNGSITCNCICASADSDTYTLKVCLGTLLSVLRRSSHCWSL